MDQKIFAIGCPTCGVNEIQVLKIRTNDVRLQVGGERNVPKKPVLHVPLASEHLRSTRIASSRPVTMSCQCAAVQSSARGCALAETQAAHSEGQILPQADQEVNYHQSIILLRYFALFPSYRLYLLLFDYIFYLFDTWNSGYQLLSFFEKQLFALYEYYLIFFQVLEFQLFEIITFGYSSYFHV